MQKYTRLQRVLHWVSVLLFALVVTFGFMMEDMPRWALQVHLVMGISLLAVSLLRIYLHMRYKRPDYPPEVDNLSRRLAKIVQYSMLGLLMCQPIVGLIIYNSPSVIEEKIKYKKGGERIETEWEMEYTTDIGETFADIHEGMAIALLILIFLHFTGLCKHLVVDRINLIRRMW